MNIKKQLVKLQYDMSPVAKAWEAFKAEIESHKDKSKFW